MGRPGKPILQYTKDGEFIRRFNSAEEAGEELFTHPNGIRMCCKKKRETAGGYRWRYENEPSTDK